LIRGIVSKNTKTKLIRRIFHDGDSSEERLDAEHFGRKADDVETRRIRVSASAIHHKSPVQRSLEPEVWMNISNAGSS